MSVSGVENSGGTRSEQVRVQQSEDERRASEERKSRANEDARVEENLRTSDPGRGENMDIVA